MSIDNLLEASTLSIHRFKHKDLPDTDSERIKFSIKCLLTALSMNPTPSTQAKLHLKVSRLYHLYTTQSDLAEMHCSKAYFQSSNDDAMKFNVQLLQADIYAQAGKYKAANQILTGLVEFAGTIPLERQMELYERHLQLILRFNDWLMFFNHCNRYIQICLASKAYINAAKFVILKCQRAAFLHKLEVVKSSLIEFKQLQNQLDEVEQTNHLIVQILTIEVLYLIYTGDLNSVSQLLYRMRCLLKDPDYDKQETTTAEFWDTTLPYLMSYLIFGIAHQSKDSSKAAVHLTQGLKAIDWVDSRQYVNSTIHDIAICRNALVHIRVYMLTNLIETLVARFELVQAYHKLCECTNYVLSNSKMDKFQARLLFDWALLYQTAGHRESATVLYKRLSEYPKYAWVAKYQLHLLNLDDMDSSKREAELVNTLDKSVPTQLMLLHAVQGFKGALNGEIQSTKTNLRKAMALSIPLQQVTVALMCLSLLSVLFKDTELKNSETMLYTVKRYSEQGNCDMFRAFAMKSLGEDCTELEQRISKEQSELGALLAID